MNGWPMTYYCPPSGDKIPSQSASLRVFMEAQQVGGRYIGMHPEQAVPARPIRGSV